MNKPYQTTESFNINNDINAINQLQPFQATTRNENLCAAENIWNHALLTTLLEATGAFIPVIYASAPTPNDKIPKKPPPMKYEDLPITESNEFYEYKTYLEDTAKCPGADVKIVHTFLCPIVHEYRKSLSESFFGMTKELGDMTNEACEAAGKNVKCFKKFMRDPANLLIRRVVVALGTVTGIYIGSGTRGIARKLFYGSLGALATGALCFPEETDVVFRNTSYRVGKLVIAVYNTMCGKNFVLRERGPCPDDLPPPPPASDVNKKCADIIARAEAKAKEAARQRAERCKDT